MLVPCKEYLASLLFLGFVQIVTGIPGVITDLHVRTTIEQRYAQTTVAATMKNPNVKSAELKFKMTLPKTAFISSLIMQVEGKNYTSTVKEKGAAKKTYDRAKKRGRSTGLVEQRDDIQQQFKVSTNVAAKGKVTFYVRYEELLRRVKGKYFYSIDVKPGHVVPIISVDVRIIESEPILDLNITEVPAKREVSRYQPSPNEVYLSYSHRDTSGTSGQGLDGKFAFTYDVDMRPDGGEVKIMGDYFVHHFSPEGLPKMQVHTVFVLDISYSMSDGKLLQLKDAMRAILRDIKREDSFELIAFASDVRHLGIFTGKKKSLKQALKKVKQLITTGATNLYEAFMQAIESVMRWKKPGVVKRIVFLTDGVATTGISDRDVIRRRVRERNSKKHPIFGLAFGEGADFELLKDISAENRAFARKIAFNAEAESQLKGFYEEIATPLMAEVAIKYNQYEVDQNSIVKQGTSNFYSGAEVVSAGQLMEGSTQVVPIVSGIGKNGPLQFRVQRVDIQPSDSSLEKENFVARLWAYLTVQNLLERASEEGNPRQVEILKSKALETALRFNFVTKLTSLVVVRPEDEDIEEEEEVEDEQPKSRSVPSSGLSKSRGGSIPTASRSRTNYVDKDPHFVVSVDGMPLPFCFDLHAHHGAILNLIRDHVTDISVNGKVTSVVGKSHLTYFTRLRIAFGGISLVITPKDIRVRCSEGTVVQTSLWPFYDGKGRQITSRSKRGLRTERIKDDDKGTRCHRFSSWERLAGKRFGDVMLLLPKRRELHLAFGDGKAHFVVVRSKNRHNQDFLGFYMLQERFFSANTTGIIGQFSSKNVTADTLPSILQTFLQGNSSDPIDLSVYRKNQHKVYETSKVSGYLGHRSSMLDKGKIKCIFIRNSGRGLLDGTPADYIIPCISC